MKNEEHKLQVACVKWFRYQYPNYAGRLFAIPNGGARSAVTGAMMKAEGVMAGVPDLFLAMPTCLKCGLFIEMKVGRNKPSPAQRQVMADLEEQGYDVAVCYTFDQFVDVVNVYLEGNR